MTGFQSKKLAARIMPKPKVVVEEYRIIEQQQVDKDTWYTVDVNNDVAAWIRETYEHRNDDLWYEHKSIRYRSFSRFDIHEKIYTLLSLKWQTGSTVI